MSGTSNERDDGEHGDGGEYGTGSRDDDGHNERDGYGRRKEPARSGRRLLLVVFVGALSLAGGFGYLIGSIGPQALGAVGVFGVTLFQPTPVGMALYGATITGFVLGVIALGARVAVNWERHSSKTQNK